MHNFECVFTRCGTPDNENPGVTSIRFPWVSVCKSAYGVFSHTESYVSKKYISTKFPRSKSHLKRKRLQEKSAVETRNEKGIFTSGLKVEQCDMVSTGSERGRLLGSS